MTWAYVKRFKRNTEVGCTLDLLELQISWNKARNMDDKGIWDLYGILIGKSEG
jgi:hypothetical protein